MKEMNLLGWIAFILVIAGALNWGLIGLFEYDLVGTTFGTMSTMSRIVYDLVGLSAIYLVLSAAMKMQK